MNSKNNSSIRFIGIISESFLAPFLDDPVLGPQINLEDYIEHNRIGRILGQSAVLLLLLSDFANNAMYTPGKFFEYLAVGRPILCLAPRQGEAASIIDQTKSGIVCEPSDQEGIKKSIRSLYQDFESHKPFNQQGVEEFSRLNLTNALVDVLEHL